METQPLPAGLSKSALYLELSRQLSVLMESESDSIANLANCAALIFHSVPRINWAGFYLLKGNDLVVGPFQGRPACTRIALGRGVCGTAAEKACTIRVPNVAEFPGHIACDSASRSEIVVPIMGKEGGSVFGVLDIDSPDLDRFDEADQRGIEGLAAVVTRQLWR